MKRTDRILFAAVAIAVALTAFSIAASAATINPPPGAEGDTLAIVAATCPTCVRVSDDLDIDFSAAEGYWIFAFEDRWKYSDMDYNDLIVEARFTSGALDSWAQVAKYSSAAQSFGYDGRYVYTAATGDPWVSTSWSNPAWNMGGPQDLVATWTLPRGVSEVPESSVLSMMLLSLAAFGVWRWRR